MRRVHTVGYPKLTTNLPSGLEKTNNPESICGQNKNNLHVMLILLDILI